MGCLICLLGRFNDKAGQPHERGTVSVANAIPLRLLNELVHAISG